MTTDRPKQARRPLATVLTLAVGGLLLASASPVSAAEIPLDLGGYASRTLRFEGAAADDTARRLVGGCDVDDDGTPDLLIGAQRAAGGAGRVYVVPGDAARAPGTYALEAPGSPLAGAIVLDGDPTKGAAGSTLDCAGDVNGDGVDDIVIGATGTVASRAYVVFGGAALANTSPLDLGDLGAHGFELQQADDYGFGVEVAGVGDLDGDGKAEIAVHSLWGDDPVSGGDYSGTTYVVPGRADTTPITVTDSGATLLEVHGPATLNDGSGVESIAGAGDVDGDGVPDLLLGVPSFDGPNGDGSGAAYVVSGAARGDVDLAGGDDPGLVFPIWGPDPATRGSAGGFSARAVAAAGDVDDDGKADVAIGSITTPSPPVPGHGVVSVVYGKANGAAVDLQAPGTAAYDVEGVSATARDGFGGSIAALGDVDGDGNADLALGAAEQDAPGGIRQGAAYVVYGRDDAQDLMVEDLECDDGARLYGAADHAGLGFRVASGGAGFTGAAVPHLVAGGLGYAVAVPLADVPGSCSDEPEPPEEVFYEIDWGFRENFRNYVDNGWRASAPAVPIMAEAGARCDPNPNTERGGCDPRVDQSSATPLRALRWTAVGAGATDGRDTTIAGRGRVIFRYPAHFFTFTLEDPWIAIAGGQATLRARIRLDVTDPDSAFGIGSADVRVPMATFPLAGPPRVTDQYVRWRFEPGVLTREAADSLGTFLGAGAELDSLTITIPRTLGGLPEEPGVPRRDDPIVVDPPRTGPPVVVPPPLVDPPRIDPPRADPPRSRMPTIAPAPAGALRVGADGRVTLTRVRCAFGTCTVRTPRSVRFRIGRRRFAARVVAPRRLRAGQSGTVRLVLARRAVRALAGRRATVRVRIEVRSNDGRTVRTLGVKLRRPRG